MRTQKRFTPTVLERFMRENRGQGIYEDYIAWHKVSRGDPASSGRSHLLRFRGRLHDLLSDGEFRAQAFILMLPGLEDVLEQFPLDHDASLHPACAYFFHADQSLYPGTVAVADQLNISHPLCKGKVTDRKTPLSTVLWTMTTDFLVAMKGENQTLKFLAVSIKPSVIGLKERDLDLMRIEREYWSSRSIDWLLITQDQYEKAVGLTLARSACWALAPAAPKLHLETAVRLARESPSGSLCDLLASISDELGSLECAQCALWQSIWSGALLVRLSRGWRPHLPFQHMSEVEFWQQNPMAARRSAWI